MGRTFHAEWSEDDREYVGKCDQYPSLSWLAPTEAEALVEIMMLVIDIDNGS
jgi:hypothetical protein